MSTMWDLVVSNVKLVVFIWVCCVLLYSILQLLFKDKFGQGDLLLNIIRFFFDKEDEPSDEYGDEDEDSFGSDEDEEESFGSDEDEESLGNDEDEEESFGSDEEEESLGNDEEEETLEVQEEEDIYDKSKKKLSAFTNTAGTKLKGFAHDKGHEIAESVKEGVKPIIRAIMLRVIPMIFFANAFLYILSAIFMKSFIAGGYILFQIGSNMKFVSAQMAAVREDEDLPNFTNGFFVIKSILTIGYCIWFIIDYLH